METKTISIVLLALVVLAVAAGTLIYVSSGNSNSTDSSCGLYKVDGELAYRNIQMDEVRFGLDIGTVETVSADLLAAYEKYDDSAINELLGKMELCKSDVFSEECSQTMNEMKQQVHLLAADRYENKINCGENYANYTKDGRLYLAMVEFSNVNVSDSVFNNKETALADALYYYDNPIIANYTATYKTCYEKDKTDKSCYISIQYALFRAYDEMKERY